MDFQLLCEQIIIEEGLKHDLAQIGNEATIAKRRYLSKKRTDKVAALNQFKIELIELRSKLKDILEDAGLFQDGDQMDDFIEDKWQYYPGLNLLLSTVIGTK